MFVPSRRFQPSQIFASKAGAYQNGATVKGPIFYNFLLPYFAKVHIKLVFGPSRSFQPGQMFASKAGAYQSGATVKGPMLLNFVYVFCKGSH